MGRRKGRKLHGLDSEIKKQASPAAEGIEGLSVKKQ
jgi:hypothetical protein